MVPNGVLVESHRPLREVALVAVDKRLKQVGGAAEDMEIRKKQKSTYLLLLKLLF